MKALSQFENIYLVTAIIPQHHAQYCLQQISANFGLSALQFDARGTLAHNRWYQRFLPMMNPENEYLHYLLPQENVDAFLDFVIKTARLYLPGAGAIFAMPCVNYESNSPRYFCTPQPALTNSEASPYSLKTGQQALFALVQSGRTENAIRAAMQAGSHGPMVYFSEGRGTRDQYGWLKITKKPYEEVIMTLVDQVDCAAVSEAIVNAGRINMPGGGILYQQPVDKCLVNLPTATSKTNALASDHQMVAAIDQLMGNTNWRDRSAMAAAENKRSALGQKTKQSQTLCLLTILVSREHAYPIMATAIAFGAGGANVTFVKQLGGELDRDEKTGFAFHEEMGLIKIVLNEKQASHIRAAIKDYGAEKTIDSLTIFEQEISSIKRYRSSV